MVLFTDRQDAGRKLAKELEEYSHDEKVIVLGLPRGGIPVAFEVAQALNVPLDIFLVRKLGLPGHEEFAMGAIASGAVRVLNEDVLAVVEIPEAVIEDTTRREQEELEQQERFYRNGRPTPTLAGKTVILVDDGLATGATMRAAVMGIRAQEPARIIVAVPTADIESCHSFKDEVDEIICAEMPRPFQGVGRWYQNFEQIADEEVRLLLQRAGKTAVAA